MESVRHAVMGVRAVGGRTMSCAAPTRVLCPEMRSTTAEAGIGLQVAAELSLNGAPLVRRGAPPLMNPRKPPALLDLVEQRLAGRNRRHYEWHATGKRRLDMGDRAGPQHTCPRPSAVRVVAA